MFTGGQTWFLSGYTKLKWFGWNDRKSAKLGSILIYGRLKNVFFL